jgi:protein-L-isoaspartate(D-aspartate) O-methyltransferase
LKKAIVAPVPRWGASAMASGNSLGYLTARPAPDPDFVELGANAHGPDAQDFAQQLVHQVSHWNEHLRGGPGPTLQIYPTERPAAELPPGFQLRKRRHHLIITW